MPLSEKELDVGLISDVGVAAGEGFATDVEVVELQAAKLITSRRDRKMNDFLFVFILTPL